MNSFFRPSLYLQKKIHVADRKKLTIKITVYFYNCLWRCVFLCRCRHDSHLPSRKFFFVVYLMFICCRFSWRCFYYTASFVYGLVILWNKIWFWNIDHCWLDYPYQVCKFRWFIKIFSLISKLMGLMFAGRHARRVVVLHDLISLLLVASVFAVFRCQEERLLANVLTSYRHHRVIIVFVDMQSASRRNSGVGNPRRIRLYFRCKSPVRFFFFFVDRFQNNLIGVFCGHFFPLPSTPIINRETWSRDARKFITVNIWCLSGSSRTSRLINDGYTRA